MFKTIRNAWKLPELRRKLLFVIFALLIFRVGAAIPVPYINTEYLQDYIAANSGTIFGLLNTLSGSALSQATLFALSIQPYINASIIIQLLTIAIPALERLAKDGGEEGKKKIDLRGADHPPGLRLGDCRRHAAASAGLRHHRRQEDDCGGRRGHRGNGPGASEPERCGGAG